MQEVMAVLNVKEPHIDKGFHKVTVFAAPVGGQLDVFFAHAVQVAVGTEFGRIRPELDKGENAVRAGSLLQFARLVVGKEK